MRTISVRNKLMLIFAAVIVAMGTFIGYISYDSAKYMIVNNKKSEMADTINRIDININMWIMSVSRFAERSVNGTVVDKLFAEYEAESADKYEKEIQSWFEDYVEIINPISDLVVFDNEKNVMYHYQNAEKVICDETNLEKFFEEAQKEPNGEQWLGINQALYSEEAVVTMVKAIPDAAESTMRGILVVELNPDIFKNLLFNNQSLLKYQYTLIVDKQEEIICVNKITHTEWLPYAEEKLANGDSAFEMQIGREKYYICGQYNGLTGWKIYSVISIDEIYPQLSDLKGTITAAVTGALLIALILVVLFSHTLTEPIYWLVNAMKEVENENFDIEIQNTRKDEIGQLIDAFNFMVQKLRQFVFEVYQGKLAQKNTEIKALQAQINPHFLYNTLDSINWMLIEKEEYEISDIVISLGEILRYSIGGKEQIVELKDELKYVRRYLCIQKNRMEERLDYKLDIADDTLQCRVPKLILQPIIENAVLHGIEPKKEGGHVKITARREGEYLIIAVWDNGVGMQEEVLNKLRLEIFEKQINSDNVGMPNIQRRLELHYGHGSTMEIQSIWKQGTTVVLKMYVSEKNEDENGYYNY